MPPWPGPGPRPPWWPPVHPWTPPQPPPPGFIPAQQFANSGLAGTYKRAGRKKIAIIAGCAAAFIVILIAVIAIIGSQSGAKKVEQAVARMIDEHNNAIGVEYIIAPNLRSQCKDGLKNNKDKDYFVFDIDIQLVDIPDVEPFSFDMPEYSISKITHDEYRLLFMDTAQKALDKRIKKGDVGLKQERLAINVLANADGSVSADAPPDDIDDLKYWAESELEDYYAALLKVSDDFKRISIFWALEANFIELNIGESLLTDFQVKSIEKQADGDYSVSINCPSIDIFKEAVQPGYDEFASINKPPFFGRIPESKLTQAYAEGINSVAADYEATERTIIIPGENDEAISEDVSRLIPCRAGYGPFTRFLYGPVTVLDQALTPQSLPVSSRPPPFPLFSG